VFFINIFHVPSLWGGHGKISPKTLFIQEGPIYPEFLIQQPVEFPTFITHKLLTIWSRMVDHQKAESFLPIWYSGLLEFRSIRSPIVKFRSTAVLSRNRIQQRHRSLKFRNSKPFSGQSFMGNG
jgi:hypothetical protein